MKVVLVASIFFLVVIAYAQQPPQPTPLDVLQQELTAAYDQAMQIIATYQNLSQEEVAKTGRPGHFSKLAMEMAEDFFETVHDIKEVTADYQSELPPTPPNNTNNVPAPYSPQPNQVEMQNISQQVNDTLEQVKLTLSEVRSTLDQIQKERAELQLNKNQKGQTLAKKTNQYYPNPYVTNYPPVNQNPQDPNIKNNPYYAEQQADMLSDMAEAQQDMAEAAYERAMYQDYLNKMNPQAQSQAQPQVLKKQQQTEAQQEAAEEQQELKNEQREAQTEAQQEAQEAAQEAAAESQQSGSQQSTASQVQRLKITTLAKQQQPDPQQPAMSQEVTNEVALEMQEAKLEQAADMAELREEQYEAAAEAAAVKQLSNQPQRSKTSVLQIVTNVSLAVIVLGIAILILAKRNQTFDKKKSVLITKKYKNEEYTQINV